MHQLEAALILSPGNKAQTTKNGVIYVVQEYPGSLPEPDNGNDLWYQYQLYVIRNGQPRSSGQHRLFEDFIADLGNNDLDRFALIWQPIMYKDLTLPLTIEQQGPDNSTNYTEYPWDRLEDRHDAGVQYLYQQNSHIFSEHLHYCEECSINGLCPTGSQYNKICRDLEKQIFGE